MTYRDKTQSFTHNKQQHPHLKPPVKHHSPERSGRINSSKTIIESQIPSSRFLRKDISKLQEFDPRVYITSQLNYEDVVDLKQVFDTYDSSSMGVLLPNDLKLLMEQNGFYPNKTTVYDILAEFDEGETGGISFKDFMRAMGAKPNRNESKKQISGIFKKYDKEGKGYLDFANLKEASKRIKENLSDSEIEEIIKSRAGSGNPGRITFQDFYEVMVAGYKWY